MQEDPERPDYLDSGFRLVLAVNKADLLPSVVTRTRLEVTSSRLGYNNMADHSDRGLRLV